MKEITTRSQLREGNRAGEGRLWETDEPMNKNRIARPTRLDELAPHSEVLFGDSVEVNAAVVP
jgi:hypothetical protein